MINRLTLIRGSLASLALLLACAAPPVAAQGANNGGGTK